MLILVSRSRPNTRKYGGIDRDLSVAHKAHAVLGDEKENWHRSTVLNMILFVIIICDVTEKLPIKTAISIRNLCPEITNINSKEKIFVEVLV